MPTVQRAIQEAQDQKQGDGSDEQQAARVVQGAENSPGKKLIKAKKIQSKILIYLIILRKT